MGIERFYTESIYAYSFTEPFHVNEALLAHWSFDAGTAADDSGNSYNGVLTGTSTSAGKSGLALVFDGVDDNVLVSNFYQFTTDTNISIVGWIYIPSSWTWDSVNTNYLFGIGTTIGSIGLCQSTTNNTIIAGARTASELIYTAAATITRDTWYHFVASYNGTTRKISLYMNGTLIGESASALTTGISFDNFFSMGGSSVLSGTPSYIECRLDEVRVYPNALDAADSLYLYGNPTVWDSYPYDNSWMQIAISPFKGSVTELSGDRAKIGGATEARADIVINTSTANTMDTKYKIKWGTRYFDIVDIKVFPERTGHHQEIYCSETKAINI